MGMDTCGRSSSFVYKEDNFLTSCLPFCTSILPLKKRQSLRENKIAFKRSKSFPLKYIPYQNGGKTILIIAFPECISVPPKENLYLFQQRQLFSSEKGPTLNGNEFQMLASLWKTENIYLVHQFSLTFSSLQLNTDAFANSADPHEKAPNEPSHQELHI